MPSSKWTISIDGGGWCDDEVDCLCRSKGSLGSSTKQPESNWCLCSNVNEAGSAYEEDCNCLRLPYLDGASFSGYRAEPWPVPNSTETLHFRGIRNFDAAVDFAMSKGLKTATDFVLSGGSAGGLSYVRRRPHEAALGLNAQLVFGDQDVLAHGPRGGAAQGRGPRLQEDPRRPHRRVFSRSRQLQAHHRPTWRVSRHDIAGIWVAFFLRYQRYRC